MIEFCKSISHKISTPVHLLPLDHLLTITNLKNLSNHRNLIVDIGVPINKHINSLNWVNFHFKATISPNSCNANTINNSFKLSFNYCARLEMIRKVEDEATPRITKNAATSCSSTVVVDWSITVQFPNSRSWRVPELTRTNSIEVNLRVESWISPHAIDYFLYIWCLILQIEA